MNLTLVPRSVLTFMGSAITRLIHDGPVSVVSKFVRVGIADESVFTSIAGHWRVTRLMCRRQTRILIRHHPQLLYRYVSENLARSFPKRWRREILIHHYGFLMERLPEDFFQVLLTGGRELWRGSGEHDEFSIRLSFTGSLHFDGDLLLSFARGDDSLYQLAFTIVPGWMLGSGLDNALLISRIQGARGKFEAIRHATKACKEVSLPHQLVASAQGIAEALGISMIAGLRIEEFPQGAEASTNIQFDYDAFWGTFVSESQRGFYLISVPPVEKSSSQVNATHRRRAALKRKFRTAIRETARQRFRDEFRILAGPSKR
jgi:uncharacterized protein VirK/YbjX